MNNINSKKLPVCILKFLANTRNPFKIISNGECPDVDDKHGVIYCINHTNSFDIPISLQVCKRYPIVLMGKQRLTLSERLFCFLNGTCWVDRGNKGSTEKTKDELIALLKQGKSILWFPEGTWNMTDNLLCLPMKWGIIEVSKRADADIIPISLNYDRTNMICNVDFGQPSKYINKKKGIHHLRDQMATLKYIQIERNGIHKRSDINIESERKQIQIAIDEYPQLEWEKEKNFIYETRKEK